MKMKKIILIFVILSVALCAQNNQEYTDISSYLKQIEKGQIEKIRKEINILIKEKNSDPNLIFLDAVITPDGQIALDKYNRIVNEFPHSEYADASLYRVYAYYYAVGLYSKSNEYSNLLKREYADSPYIKNCIYVNIPQKTENSSKEKTNPANEKDEKRFVKNDQELLNNNKNFTIQLGAFSSKENAQKIIVKAKEAGYKCNSAVKNKLTVITINYITNENESEDIIIQKINKKLGVTAKILK